MINKIKTILTGIDGLEKSISDKDDQFFKGQAVGLHFAREIILREFPELRESEDERIRKWLSDILDVSYWRNDWPHTKQQVINYLEKQKEQKPLLTEETELNSIAFLEQLGYTCVPPGAEQKPAEWGEEDIKKIRSEEYTKGFNDAAFGGKLKEWSEEDERIANEILDHFNTKNAEWFNWFNARFKSLRPQPHWKPSEEQMKTLEYYMVALVCTKNKEVLFGLYSDLKELTLAHEDCSRYSISS